MVARRISANHTIDAIAAYFQSDIHSEESNVHRDNDFIGYAYACSEGARSVSEVYHELNVLTERPVTYCGINDIVWVQYWRTGMRSSSECSHSRLIQCSLHCDMTASVDTGPNI